MLVYLVLVIAYSTYYFKIQYVKWWNGGVICARAFVHVFLENNIVY